MYVNWQILEVSNTLCMIHIDKSPFIKLWKVRFLEKIETVSTYSISWLTACEVNDGIAHIQYIKIHYSIN